MEGFDPHVSSLTWPDSVSPLDLPGFETQARRLRYQALGEACRKSLHTWLLLAHHDDDQAETVLMRLASGHKGIGLLGIPRRADIPECLGMHGLHRSGARDRIATRLAQIEKNNASDPRVQRLRQVLAEPGIMENGGVKIMRPLLGFRKERLIETCRAQSVSWEEDKTNEDIWRTPRNSVRALLRSAKLPQALQTPSMLRLAKHSQDIYHKQIATAMRIQTCCEILLFDVRCGALVVRFPRHLTKSETEVTGWSKSDLSKYVGKVRLTALLLLRKLVRTVTPQEEVPLKSLEQAVVSIFPDLSDRDTLADRTLQPTSLTASGIQFQKLHSPLAAPQSELDSSMSWLDHDPNFVWKLTRQPFVKAPPSLIIQPSAKPESPVAPSWSSWHLWDGRYWIRLLHRSCQPLTVRSFQPSDLQHLQSRLGPQRYKQFHESLHLIVPGKVRWTLLALAEIEDDSLPMGRILALPTLGQVGTFDARDASGTNKVEWQIRYKHITLGYQQSDDGYRRVHRNSDLITSWLD